MENRKILKKLLKTSDIETASYLSQISLELAGDIEKNPGPNKKINSVHPEILILLLLSLIIIIEKKESNFNFTHPNIKTGNINFTYVLTLQNKRNIIIKPTAKYLIIILLLISNDIETNPGPKNQNNRQNSKIISKFSSKYPCKLCLESPFFRSPESSFFKRTKPKILNLCLGYECKLCLPSENSKYHIKTKQYISLLLLTLSNDIETNPGPKETNCSNCKQKTDSTNKLQCNHCNKIFHKNCVITKNVSPGSKVQWILYRKKLPSKLSYKIF